MRPSQSLQPILIYPGNSTLAKGLRTASECAKDVRSECRSDIHVEKESMM